MLLYGHEREVQQGEDWNLDILLSQSSKEYIPFLISSERKNPYFAITVASTKYEKNYRYVKTWWLEVKDVTEGDARFFKFFQTVPHFVGDKSKEDVEKLYNFTDKNKYFYRLGKWHNAFLYQYTLPDENVDPVLGHKPYHYLRFDEQDNSHEDGYDCHIRMQFTSEETAKWGSQNYMYQITLVDTESMGHMVRKAKQVHPTLPWSNWPTKENNDWIDKKEALIQIEGNENKAWKKFEENWAEENIKELFPFIKLYIPDWFQPDIDWDAPVGWIGTPQIILPPTKLQVNNNLRTII